MVTDSSMSGRALDRVMVPIGPEKTIESVPAELFASIIACRRDPAPESLFVVTVYVAAMLSGRTQNSGISNAQNMIKHVIGEGLIIDIPLGFVLVTTQSYVCSVFLTEHYVVC